MLQDVFRKDIKLLYETPIVQQTAFWSAVKNKLGSFPVAVNFRYAKTITSDLLVLIQPLDEIYTIAYVPYGPELQPDEASQGPFLEELSECLRSFLPKNCITIRYDLCWESYWAKDNSHFSSQGDWLGEPSVNAQEFRFNCNTVKWNFKKAHFNILPSSTIYLNLNVGKENMLDGMKPKTRYNIRLAHKKGVNVRVTGIENLGIWYDLYRDTAIRNNIFLNDIIYFETVLSTKVDNSLSPAEVMLLVAEWDGIPLAAMFLIISGTRGSYLYGASSSEHRNLMATYALQWEAIRISKEKGCTEYDMFGISPGPDPSHPLYGLYKFKTGFGGKLYHSLGCWDYPLINDKYNEFRSSELLSRGFHLDR